MQEGTKQIGVYPTTRSNHRFKSCISIFSPAMLLCGCSIRGKADDLDQAIGRPLLFLFSHRSITAGGTPQLCLNLTKENMASHAAAEHLVSFFYCTPTNAGWGVDPES